MIRLKRCDNTAVLKLVLFSITSLTISTVISKNIEIDPQQQLKSESAVGGCGSVRYETCRQNRAKNVACEVISIPIDDYLNRKELESFHNVSNILSATVKKGCQMALCDDEDLMGYCAYLLQEGLPEPDFRSILQPGTISTDCTCQNYKERKEECTQKDMDFDRNYVGVVFSPYDKYWEKDGPNGTYRRISWQSYSEKEIRASLKQIATKFSYVATYGVGTTTNETEWYEGDKIAYVAPLAADLNLELGYPAVRVSVGIFRKDDVNLKWNSKELLNAVEVAKVSNTKFNGTVWGVTVTSDYVSDVPTANDAIDMIRQVREMSDQQGLRLKVGIRLGKCFEFIANKRPEDDTGIPAYQHSAVDYVPRTSFQSSLRDIAELSDYILCLMFPSSKYAQLPVSSILEVMQSQFLQLRQTLRKINPKLKLVIETGVPSKGVGNGFQNTLENLQEFWYSMAEFAHKEKVMFHLFEAMDQPWKNVQDNTAGRVDINGPNGADAHYGWWRRANNSDPPTYLEKVQEIVTKPEKEESGGWKAPTMTKILVLGFCAFVCITLASIGYLGLKLRKARREVISRTYINQFHSGVGECNTDDTNYAVALRIPYNREYELPKDSFDMDKGAVIGSGQSGVVLRGTIRGNPVAFKCTTNSSTVIDIKAIMSEIKILCYIGQHDNIVCILGAYTKKIQRGIVYVALEYCPLGSVESFLKKLSFQNISSSGPYGEKTPMKYVSVGKSDCLSVENPAYVSTYFEQPPGYVSAEAIADSGYLTPNQLNSLAGEEHKDDKDTSPIQIHESMFLRWSYQIASAMEYVSAKNVIHADLAARNILLASMDQVKVSDFGLSRKLYQEMGVVHDKDTPLPWRWMAPESLKHLVFSVETDVWAFGVTLWEIFSMAEVPYHGISYDMQFAGQLVDGTIQLPQPKYASDELQDMLIRCWEISPINRPNFSQLKEFFHKATANSQSN